MFVHTRCRLITKKNTLAAFNSTGEEENGIKKRENSYPSSSRPNLLGHVGLYQTQPELLTTPSLIYYYNLLLFLSLSLSLSGFVQPWLAARYTRCDARIAVSFSAGGNRWVVGREKPPSPIQDL